jgi:superfamily II DNA or RNA helicase/very-short-patch-repair endonuclease
MNVTLDHVVSSDSYLEAAFLRWVLTPCVLPTITSVITPQHRVQVEGRNYRIDYALHGASKTIAVELDGYAFHSDRGAFTYDRLRQNDLTAAGVAVVRFSYDAVRTRTAMCVEQLAAVLRTEADLAKHVRTTFDVQVPDMPADPAYALLRRDIDAPDQLPENATYFDRIRLKLDTRVLRGCQQEGLAALANYYGQGDANAACVMSVGAGKTALGVAAALTFTRRRALIVTPGTVVRGTFDTALDGTQPRNVLYSLPAGPLLPGNPGPCVRTLDADAGAISAVSRNELLGADILITNFHSLGTKESGNLLAKLDPDDIDFIVVDEAHIAAADSYQRLFARFPNARTLLMSACFQRLDGRPIEADVVYRYRLIDSINDGTAKNLRIHRFAPNSAETTYQLCMPGGGVEMIVGRAALVDLLRDERKLAHITAISDASIHQVMNVVASCLAAAREVLHPVKPRVLFAALGQAHAEQVATIARDHNIACDVLHHSMTPATIKSVRTRFESDAGDLDGIVQLKMLGQGYDFPPICLVVPMRPFGSFGEFYQFIGRGIRVINDGRLSGRVGSDQQLLDVVVHNELGLDEHLASIYAENDMDPSVLTEEHEDPSGSGEGEAGGGGSGEPMPALVLVERGMTARQVLYDQDRLEARQRERRIEAMAFKYEQYATRETNPVTFEQYCTVMSQIRA